MEDRSYPVLLRERDARIKELERKLGETEAMTAIIIRERDAAEERLVAADRLADAVSVWAGLSGMEDDDEMTDNWIAIAKSLTAYTQTKDTDHE